MTERPFLTAHWRDLVMVSWAVDPRLLRATLPRGLELDLWRGEALVSVVAFRFEQVRVRGLAIPCHTNFPEVNLRYYVRRRADDGTWRRGVVFIQEMVPKRAVATVARRLYGEPYVARPMRDASVPASSDGAAQRTLVYEWQRDGVWERLVALTTRPTHPMRAGSTEEFIAEHYFGYTGRGSRATQEYRVAHPRWKVVPLADGALEADVARLYGPAWVEPLSTVPRSAFLADGSDVAVYPGVPVPGTSHAPDAPSRRAPR